MEKVIPNVQDIINLTKRAYETAINQQIIDAVEWNIKIVELTNENELLKKQISELTEPE